MTSIKDIAKIVGVSTATVSRALSNSSYVSDKVRAKVMEAVSQSGYRPNRLAQSLRAKSSSTIGLIVADIQNPFFTAVSRAVQDAAYENDISVFLCNTDEDETREKIYLELMRDEHTAGIIIAPTHQTDESIQLILEQSIPCVVIDREIPDADIDTVVINNEDAGYRLTKHMIKTGKNRICIIAGSGSTTGALRLEGCRRAMNEHGINTAHQLIYPVKASEAEGYRVISEIASQGDIPFDGIIATNGLVATGIYQKLHELKVRIPDEVAFACFDETVWTRLVDPDITVIRQPTAEIGRTAVELLIRRIKEENRPSTRKVVLNTELVVRKSTGANNL
jgi:LacI family transcriptional regulator, fructose operon transcriptional repressor